MPEKVYLGEQLHLSGARQKLIKFIWAPGEFAALKAQVEVKKCYSCDKTVVGRRINWSECYAPWADEPDLTPYCEACTDRGLDHEQEFYCDSCDRWVTENNGWRSHLKPNPEYPDELICVRCFQEHQLEHGHTMEQLNHKRSGYWQVAMDFYTEGELIAHGWSKAVTITLDRLLNTKGAAWQAVCLEYRRKGYLVITDQGLTGIGNPGPDWVDLWIKRDPECEEEDDTSFNNWLDEVDRVIGKKVGLSYLDLPDQTWRDWFDDEMTPEEAADLALEDAGYATEFDDEVEDE